MDTSIGRCIATVALAAFGAFALGQNWVSQGGINSREYQNQIREGGQVVATDFFTLEYSVATWIEELGDGGGPTLVCTNKCGGNVHRNHAGCDYSCDARCTESHRKTVKGDYFPDRSAMDAATAAANGLATRGGGTSSPSDWSHRVSQALADFRREAKKRKTFDMPHAGPCSGRSWTVDIRTKAFHVRGTMKKVGYRMSRGVRTPINEVVGMHESVVATGKFVQDEPKDKQEWTDCRCKAPADPPVDIDALIDRLIEMLKRLEEEERRSHLCGYQAVMMRDKAGKHVYPGESKIVVKPADMNRCQVEIENGTGTDVEVTIPIGTYFEAVNPADQDMSSVTLTRGMLYAGEKKTFYVSLRPELAQTTAQFPVRWACLNIAKKEPTPASRYRMRSPQDDVLIRMGVLTEKSPIRGPHDQARVWIYTDKAPIDEVNKRMAPGVTEGRYSTLLWEAVTKAGADVSPREYHRCLEPKLLAGIPLNDEATGWLVSTLAEFKARDLARYVDGSARTLVGLAESNPEYGPGHVATLATAMMAEDNADVRKAGLKLVSAMPAGARAAFARAGGLSGVRSLLTGGNNGEVSSAVDALLLYPKELSGDLLGASWEQLPTEALKTKARKFLGIE